MNENLKILLDFVNVAANGPLRHFGYFNGRIPQYSNEQVDRALAAIEALRSDEALRDSPDEM